MSDRELLELILNNVIASQTQIANLELKFDEFVKEYEDRLYGFARDANDAAK